MIHPTARFYCQESHPTREGYRTFSYVDFDQRRYFAVTYAVDTDDYELLEEVCTSQLHKHADHLPEDVTGFSFSKPDGPITTSTDMYDDFTTYMHYMPLSEIEDELPFPPKTINIMALKELDRLAPQVDKVSYCSKPCVGTAASTTTAAFKYFFLHTFVGPVRHRTWYEMQTWIRLPRDHPHIVPFDAVVLDALGQRIVGFTTLFIPGGTVSVNATTRPFQLKWLHQFCDVIDYLNYDLGITHQDLHTRNIIIDEKDNLRIFDFDYARMLGDKDIFPKKNDTDGLIYTMYNIITQKEDMGNLLLSYECIKALQDGEWVKHPDVTLDSPVSDFRKVIDAWARKRRQREFKPKDTWIKVPIRGPLPEAPGLYHMTGEVTFRDNVETLCRSQLRLMHIPFYSWERPPSSRLQERREDADAAEENGEVGDSSDSNGKRTTLLGKYFPS